MNRVDLFVAGPDFYLGSTKLKGRLKDGWCNFSKLGRQKVSDLGSSFELGKDLVPDRAGLASSAPLF